MTNIRILLKVQLHLSIEDKSDSCKICSMIGILTHHKILLSNDQKIEYRLRAMKLRNTLRLLIIINFVISGIIFLQIFFVQLYCEQSCIKYDANRS